MLFERCLSEQLVVVGVIDAAVDDKRPGRVEPELDRQRPVVVLCHAGMRSWQFASWLIEAQDFSDVWKEVALGPWDAKDWPDG